MTTAVANFIRDGHLRSLFTKAPSGMGQSHSIPSLPVKYSFKIPFKKERS
jgi:hypothetical protein